MNMEETEFFCPTCNEDTEHEILKESPGKLLVKCLECGSIHNITREPEPREMFIYHGGIFCRVLNSPCPITFFELSEFKKLLRTYAKYKYQTLWGRVTTMSHI